MEHRKAGECCNVHPIRQNPNIAAILPVLGMICASLHVEPPIGEEALHGFRAPFLNSCTGNLQVART